MNVEKLTNDELMKKFDSLWEKRVEAIDKNTTLTDEFKVLEAEFNLVIDEMQHRDI